MSTALLISNEFARHKTMEGHPECPARISAVQKGIVNIGLIDSLQLLPQRKATDVEVAYCHDPRYISGVLKLIREGEETLAGGDVSVSEDSGEVALLAAGGVLNAVDAVLKKEVDNAFCAVRPPGHHARPAAAMGFCIFNSISIAARYAQKKYGLERVAIVDWDVHHGNGTQEIFYEDNSVFFFSTHQNPWYPGTGMHDETGEGRGSGFTLNRPFHAGSGGREIIGAFKDDLLPALEKFRPELILISAGFDSRAGDPLGNFQLTDADFALLTSMLLDAAAKHCEGRLISVLEGGYSLSGLASAAGAHVGALVG
ncbi:MAG: histone deacetylase [Chthoniobacterales bacterium]